MSKTTIALAGLKAGQTIFSQLKLEAADIVPSLKNSSTSKLIQKGQPVKRMSVVLEVSADRVKVAYLATFKEAQTLASMGLADEAIEAWYPVKPSPKEGKLDPLDLKVPTSAGKAQWVSLRKMFDVTDDYVEVLGSPIFGEDAVTSIKNHLKSAA